jgi:hypothetical protein
LLGFALSKVAGSGSGSRRLAAGAIALFLAVTWGGRVREELAEWGLHGEEVRSFARAVREVAPDLGPEDGVRLVNVPLSFSGALQALAGGRLPRIEHLNFASTPAYAFLPEDLGFRPAEGRRAFTFVRDAWGLTHRLDGEDPAEGRERLAGALLYYDAREVGSWEEAERALASGGVDPRRTVLVEGARELPQSDREMDRAERVLGMPVGATGLRVRFRARAAREGVFVYVPEIEDAALLWFRPDPHHELLEREAAVVFPRGEARLDGVPVEWLRANALYRAVRIPPGEHEVEFVFTL